MLRLAVLLLNIYKSNAFLFHQYHAVYYFLLYCSILILEYCSTVLYWVSKGLFFYKFSSVGVFLSKNKLLFHVLMLSFALAIDMCKDSSLQLPPLSLHMLKPSLQHFKLYCFRYYVEILVFSF
jgi:hypothetical protein